MQKKSGTMKKSIILFICASLTLVFSSYAWFLNNTSGDVGNLKFITSDTVNVKFWGYNVETEEFDIELDDGDLMLSGMKGGSKRTIRIEISRTKNLPKALYIKMIGVEVVGIGSVPLYTVTVGEKTYSLADFLSVDIKTVGTSPSSITVNADPNEIGSGEVYFSETTDTLAKVLEIVQGYEWPATAENEEDEPLYLDMTITLRHTLDVLDENDQIVTIDINNYQKQSIKTRALNVQGIDI